MLKTVYFDLGNVLLFFSVPKMLTQIGKCTGMSPNEVENLFYGTALRKQYETGLINTQQLYQAFCQKAPKPFQLSEFSLALSDIFTPNIDLWNVVEDLKKQKIRLVLISNTCEAHYQYAATHFPILKLFDELILSYQIGYWKPELKIFEKALEQANCKPQECFYIDDVPEFIFSARQVGLPGEIYTTVSKFKEDIKHFLP